MRSTADRERSTRRGGGGFSPLVLLLLAPLLVGTSSASAQTADSAKSRAPVIHHNRRSFRIPFNIDPAERPRIKEVLLCVSEDQGRTWKPISRTTPDKPALAFRAPADGPYWFAVQTMDTEGRLYPPKSAEVEPRMKVIVDTRPPTIALEPNGRRGGLASVRWEVQDEAIDLESLVLEYQAIGAREWRRVPIRRPALIGQESWDAGTAEPIKVRATIADRAKNTQTTVVDLPDGTPTNPGLARNASTEIAAPPISVFASGEADAPPQFQGRPAGPATAPAASPAPANDFPAAPPASGGNGFDPFGAPERRPAAAAASTPEPSGVKTMLVPSPRFSLQYAVDDAAPAGPASVEMWVTQDGGRSWSRRGDDPDRKSPFPVDLGSEGTFGVKLVALSAANQGDQPPVPGEAPQLLIEVDSTPPVVRLDPVQVGSGQNLGKVAILWSAGDLHIGPRSITIYVRPETPGSTWQPIGPAVDNTGQFVWTLPANTPPKFHLKVEAVDQAGNVGSAETPESQPVTIDRSRPRSRILGLEPGGVRSGMRQPSGSFR